MPPKKDAIESSDLITGFSDKECKLLAAAFISCTGPDKYDYDIMAALTKNTAGSLKKMWPPVKKKAMEAHPSYASFLGQTSAAAPNGEAKPSPAPKAAAGKKRKASDENADENNPDPNSDGGKSDVKESDSKKKSAPKKAPAAKGKGRTKKVAKKESTSGDEAQVQAENSADGGDGLDQEIEDEA